MKKILFIRLSSLGDIVLTESCIRLASLCFPNHEIHYLTKPEYGQMIEECFQKTREVTGYEENKNLVHKVYLYQDKINLLKKLRKEKYDFVVDLHNKLNTLLIKICCKGKKTITYQKQHFTRWRMVKQISKRQIDSVVWNYLKTSEKIKLLAHSNDKNNCLPIQLEHAKQFHYPILTPNTDTINVVKEKFLSYGIPFDRYLIGVFPGASHLTKQYPAEKFINFINNVPDSWKCCFLIMGDWKEKHIFLKMKSLSDVKLFDMVGVFNIVELVAAISLLDVVISNDSGPMHVAASLKKHQVVLYGATHTRLGFRPLNDKAVIIQKNIACQPCSLHGGKKCKKNTMDCFKKIPSSEVYEVFKKTLENMILE